MVPGYPAMTTASSDPISIPSSSAFVETTARMSPSRSLRSISRRSLGKISAAISANGFGSHRQPLASFLQIGQQHLGRQAVIGKYQRLLAPVDELQRNPASLVKVASPDAELLVDDRRIIEDEVLLAGGRAVSSRPVRTADPLALPQALSDSRWWPSSRETEATSHRTRKCA